MLLRTLLTLAFLLSAMPAHACPMTEDEKQGLFKSYDTSGDDALSVEEFTSGEKARAPELTDDQLVTKFEETDEDKSGNLTLSEFQPINLKLCL